MSGLRFRWPRAARSRALWVTLVLVGAAWALAPAAMGHTMPASGNPPVRVGLLFGTTATPQVTISLSDLRGLGNGPSTSPSGTACSVVGAGYASLLTAENAAGAWATPTVANAAPIGGGALPAWSGGVAEALAIGPDLLAASPAVGGGSEALPALGPTITLDGQVDRLSALPVSEAATGAAGNLFSANGAVVGPFASIQGAANAVRAIEAAGLPAFPDTMPGNPAAGNGTSAQAGGSVRVYGVWHSGESPAGVAEGTVSTLSHLGAVLGSTVRPYLSTSRSVLLIGPAGTGLVAPAVLLGTPCSLSVSGPGPTPAGGRGPYAGALTVSRGHAGSPLTVVDTVSLETYVAGVVPLEMPASWPPAALEAQAIACRTYALNALDTRNAAQAYVLTDTPADQMYGGLGVVTPATTQAVLATWGEIVEYGGVPIEALYEADSGGATASSVHVWGTAVPYLTHVAEPKGYVSPYQWTVTLSVRALARDFASVGGTDVGRVIALHTLARGRSGRVIRLEGVGTKGRADLTDDTVRTGLGFLSNLFHLRSDTPVTVRGARITRTVEGLDGLSAQSATGSVRMGVDGTASLRGASRFATLPLAPTAFVFTGRGDGPGLGMTQYGARLLAERGATAVQILLYYYRGATMGLVPVPEAPAVHPGG